MAGEKEGRPSRDTSAPPQDLLYRLTSRKAWQQERALQLCTQLLGTYEELFKREEEPHVLHSLSLLATAWGGEQALGCL